MKSAGAVVVFVLLAGCGSGPANHDAGGAAGASGAAGDGTGGSAGAAGGSGRGGSSAGGTGGRGGSAGATGGAAGGSGGRGGSGGSSTGSGGTGGGVSCPNVPGPSCPFTACGGDLAGTWTIDSGCMAASQLVWVATLGCDDVDVSKSTITASGTWTFGADMTYTRMITEQITLDFTEPITCDSSATACSNVSVLDYAATCTGTGCCSCTQVRPASTATDSGTYAVSGSTVTLTLSGGQKLPYQYCVSGNTVTLSLQAGSLITAHR